MKLTAPIAKAYSRNVLVSMLLQVLLLLLSLLATDGGQLTMWVLQSIPIFWFMVAVIVTRRPRNPTQVDLMVIRYGFVMILIAVIGSITLKWNLDGTYVF